MDVRYANSDCTVHKYHLRLLTEAAEGKKKKREKEEVQDRGAFYARNFVERNSD